MRQHSPHRIQRIRAGVKGVSLRRSWADGANSGQLELATEALDGLFDLLDRYEASLLGQVYIKSGERPFYGQQLYELAIDSIASLFQLFLEERDDQGVIVIDSRNDIGRHNTTRALFATKLAPEGDGLSRIIELPVHGNDLNHAGLQMADWVASGLFLPISVRAYRPDANWSGSGNDPGYDALTARYLPRIKVRSYTSILDGQPVGGLSVADYHGGQGGLLD